MKKPEGLNWISKAIKSYDVTQDVLLIGVRGFYGKNKRGIYDDALFWVNQKTGFIASYNANTDPSYVRKGSGYGKLKGMAKLKAGIWKYKIGPHNGYPAFRQFADVIVIRDGAKGDYEHKGMHAINIHRGSTNGTSSLGCQTLPISQWVDFKETGYKLIKDSKQVYFDYILLDA